MNGERNIIDRLKKKDKEVIALLYDRYGSALYGVVLRIVGTESIAEDVIQDAFIKVWRNAEKYDESKGTLFTWLLNIARNTAIDKIRSSHFRHQQKTQAVDRRLAENSKHSFSMDTDQIGLRKVVEELDEKYRAVIDLIYFKGYTQREVEEELQIPIGTVKTRVKIGLRELRKIFSYSSIIVAVGILIALINSLKLNNFLA